MPSTPMFLGGSPRSGTTLLLRMLERHRNVAAIYESQIVSRLVDWLEGTVFAAGEPESPFEFRLKEYVSREEIYRSLGKGVAALFDSYAARQGRKVWVEKTPRNAIQLAELFSLFPEMRFVHVIRDGRDVAASMPKLRQFPDSVPECARIWKAYVRCARGAGSVRPSQYAEVRYEDLVREPERTMQRVSEFLALPYDPATTELSEVKVSLFVENWGADASPEAPIGRWRRIADFPREEFKKVAGDLLVELGYEKNANW